MKIPEDPLFTKVKERVQRVNKRLEEKRKINDGKLSDIVPEERVLTPDEESIHRLNQINGLAESQE